MSRTTLASLALILAATAAPALLIVMTDEPSGLEKPESVFEATITAHAIKGDRGTITVRVTDDWKRVYRGRRHLGTTRVIPYGGSAKRKAIQFAQKQFGGRVLLVVGREGQVAIVAGVPADADAKGYRILSWNNSDHGVVAQIHAARVLAGSGGVMSIPDSLLKFDIRDQRFTSSALTHRWAAEFTAFHRSLVRRLAAGPQLELSDDEIRQHLSDLGHRDYGRRCAAQRGIELVAAHAPDRLRDALAAASDPEVRRRLQRALAGSIERGAIERAAAHLEKHGDAAVASAVDWKLPALARGFVLVPGSRSVFTGFSRTITLRPIVIPTVFPTPLKVEMPRLKLDITIDLEKK